MVVDVHSGERRIIFRPSDGRNAVDVTWSPDGSQAAVTVAAAFNQPDSAASVWIVDRAGTSARRLVERFDWEWTSGPDW
jgi:dipeptidyl aminopeptidase/acylaminoacyl peptidase